jgi:uncharacterized membrane-anchored protein YitT (DUF2179 family)
MATNISIGRFIKEYALLHLGCVLYCFAWTTIVQSAGIVGGGSSGLALLIQYASGGALPMGIGYIAINAVLVALALVMLGRNFGIKTIFCIASIALWLNLFNGILPADMLGLGKDRLLSAILAGAISGIGVGLCFLQGGSTGGTDIVAQIINKYRRVSYGRVVMISDFFLIGSSYFVYHNNPDFPSPISMIIYSYVMVAVFSYTVDTVLAGNKQSSQIFIFSKHHEEISRVITLQLHRGVTIIDGTGAYTGQSTKVLVVMCRKMETGNILRVVKELDPDAFISVGSITGVYGKGFESYDIKQHTLKKSAIPPVPAEIEKKI